MSLWWKCCVIKMTTQHAYEYCIITSMSCLHSLLFYEMYCCALPYWNWIKSWNSSWYRNNGLRMYTTLDSSIPPNKKRNQTVIWFDFLEEVGQFREVRRGAFVHFNTLHDDVKFWNNFCLAGGTLRESASNITNEICLTKFFWKKLRCGTLSAAVTV